MTDGFTRRGFDIDLRQFQQNEANLAMYLMSRGVHTIEHKRDCGTVRTGNLFIEYAQPSGRSGIATTTADMWSFEYDVGHWLLVPTNRLKAISRVAYKMDEKRARGGDGNRYKGVLVPIRWLIPPYVDGAS